MTTTGGQDASSSSSASRSSRYRVFLSFRGEDTRRTFVDHLYTALTNAGFRTFRDDDELEREEAIKCELQRAIQESRVSIVVFSQNYASSSWCLDELVMILSKRRRGDSGHVALPVFYGVDLLEVRKQKGDCAEAFARHKEQFKFKGGEGEKASSEWKEKLKRWRDALEEAANLEGMALHNQSDGDFMNLTHFAHICEQARLLSVVGFPVANEDLMWLSYWKFEDQLEGGNELNISVASDVYQVKEVGVHLVCKEAEEKNSTLSTSLEVAQQIHPYGKVVPGFCNGDCGECKNFLVPADLESTRVIALGTHPENCTGCPDGYLEFHHGCQKYLLDPISLYS